MAATPRLSPRGKAYLQLREACRLAMTLLLLRQRTPASCAVWRRPGGGVAVSAAGRVGQGLRLGLRAALLLLGHGVRKDARPQPCGGQDGAARELLEQPHLAATACSAAMEVAARGTQSTVEVAAEWPRAARDTAAWG